MRIVSMRQADIGTTAFHVEALLTSLFDPPLAILLPLNDFKRLHQPPAAHGTATARRHDLTAGHLDVR